ncbi:MAG: hypothetical protein JXJ04_03350 [Spirochaetales bacterium]|nr:hypothetical protein [Spirochaetales bacterium]
MDTTQLHEFHFIMDDEMKTELSCLDIFKKAGSLSGTIVKILSLIAPVIKREHHWGKQRESRYKAVSPIPDDVRKHIHAYFPGELYRELKLMHADLNFYSVAQLVRFLLSFFLEMAKCFGNNVNQEFEKLFKYWDEEKETARLTHDEFIRQLQIILCHIPIGQRLLTLYNEQFSPLWKFRL